MSHSSVVAIKVHSWRFVAAVVVASVAFSKVGLTAPQQPNSKGDMFVLNAKVVDANFPQRSIEYILGRLLLEFRTVMPERSVHIVLRCRDRRIVEMPTARMLKDDSLLDCNISGELYFRARNCSVLDILQSVCPQAGLLFKTSKSGNEDIIEVGPPELLSRSGTIGRSMFRIFPDLRGRVDALALPGELPSGTDCCMAYDSAKGLLVIIHDELDPVLPVLAQALGAKVEVMEERGIMEETGSRPAKRQTGSVTND